MHQNNVSLRTLLRGVTATGVIAFTLLGAGCASLPHHGEQGAVKTPEQQVAARSLARAQTIIAQNPKATYSFMTPAYRQQVSEERYALLHPEILTLYNAKIDKVTCQSATSCRVEAAWTYQLKPVAGGHSINVGKITNVIPEHWVKIDGQWWYYLKE